MLKRIAFFEGAIKLGCDAAFDAYVNDKLAPLWTKFPGARRVEILREVEAEEGSHRYPMMLAVSYLDKAAMERALASSVRQESREVTKGLFQFFEGRIFHVVFEDFDGAGSDG